MNRKRADKPKKEKEEMISTKEFAEAMDVDYRTALNWLRAGMVPGASKKELAKGIEVWEIPKSATKMEKPKRGWPSGKKRKDGKK